MSQEVAELRDLVRQFNREGEMPTMESLAHLFEGRARDYVWAMISLGVLCPVIRLDSQNGLQEHRAALTA